MPISAAAAERKRVAIIDAGREAFTQNGYLGASMDVIATKSGASKRTVYNHFADKESLFAAVVLDTVDRGYEAFRPAIQEFEEADDVESGLHKLAVTTLVGIMSPEVLEMRRLVMAEADRFPKIGQEYYQRSWVRTLGLTTQALERLTRRGMLFAPDPAHAAYLFVWMVVSIPLNRVAFSGNDATYTPEELTALPAEAVRVFMSAYGPRAPTGETR